MNPNERAGNTFPTQARLHSTAKVEVETSKTLATLGVTLPDKCMGVEIRNEGSEIVRFNTNNEATSDNGGIAQYDTFAFWDLKENLEKIQFYAAAANDMSVFVFVMD